MLRRKSVLAFALALAACTHEEITHVTIPIVTAEPAVPTQVRPGAQRLMTVQKLYAWCDKGEMFLQVSAAANTGGWKDPSLNRLSVEGGTILFEAIATAPPRGGRVDARNVSLLTFRHHEPSIRGVTRVRVMGQANEMQADIQLPFTC